MEEKLGDEGVSAVVDDVGLVCDNQDESDAPIAEVNQESREVVDADDHYVDTITLKTEVGDLTLKSEADGSMSKSNEGLGPFEEDTLDVGSVLIGVIKGGARFVLLH